MRQPLNKDQLDSLATLCFDLAKAAFILAMLSPLGQIMTITLVAGMRSFLVGLAFTYLGLVILEQKGAAR